MSERIDPDRQEALATQTQLDGSVVNIELTLISIIQGVALSFLADHTRDVLVGVQLTFWPYAATGLLIIVLFWSRSLIHTLTVIRWPLELGHNFMYIACTLVETVTFTQLTNTMHWYALNTLFSLMIWVLFVLDLRMIRRRMRDSAGPIGSTLYAIVEREQRLNIRLFMPATVVFNLLAVVAIRVWPGFRIEAGGHVLIAVVQLASALGYLFYVIRFFTRISPLIVNTRREWRDDVLLWETRAFRLTPVQSWSTDKPSDTRLPGVRTRRMAAHHPAVLTAVLEGAPMRDPRGASDDLDRTTVSSECGSVLSLRHPHRPYGSDDEPALIQTCIFNSNPVRALRFSGRRWSRGSRNHGASGHGAPISEGGKSHGEEFQYLRRHPWHRRVAQRGWRRDVEAGGQGIVG
jgi:hypothetical protein